MLRTCTGLIALSFAALAACAGDAPTNPPALGAGAIQGDVVDAGDPVEALAADFGADAAMDGARAANAATGGRAGGHADFTVQGIRSKYTFTSVQTVAPAAKGRFELHRWFPDGRMLVMTGDVECMTIVPRPNGGLARMTGRVDRLRVDNVDVVVPPQLDRTIWSVLDNGEGNDVPPDVASGLLNFRSAAEAAAHCAVGIIPRGFVITRGNLQVKPG